MGHSFELGSLQNFSFHYYLILMEFGNFLEFIYFSLLAISMNFPNQIVTVIRNPILKD